MLNEWLLREGLAELFTFPPNVKYVDKLKAFLHEGQGEQDRNVGRRGA
jgi:hypothetical protein